MLFGDLNIWHKRWLKFSPCNTLEGERLHTICKEHSLKQLVREPTRGPNLLDLVLSSLHASKVAVLPKIADHNALLINIDLPAPRTTFTERTVWDFKFADWEGLNTSLSTVDFVALLGQCSVDEAARVFTDRVVAETKKHIPTRTIRERKGSHPWLDDACRKAILSKHLRDGFDDYEEACQECTRVLREAYAAYINKVRAEMRSLPRGSKRWWSLANTLMDGQPENRGIPSLRDASGKWVHDGREKSELFAEIFASKYVLPENVRGDPRLDDLPPQRMSSFVLVRERWVRREFRQLRVDQATGPDELPARILKNCASSLSRGATFLFRKMLSQGQWPDMWKYHRVAPLYKKGVVHKPNNYRGLHLTPVLSKVAERVINIPFRKYVEAIDAFGSSQWAFRRGRGCTDLVLLLLCSWLKDFQMRRKIGVFLSDISGAFDRVDADKMLKKLQRIGVCDVLLRFFRDFLAPRRARVAVDGAESSEFVLRDMVFQGTVFGPCLWNIFFADIHEPAERTGCRERRFADDLSTTKAFRRHVFNDDILDAMRECQHDVHEWGVTNRVSFDPTKENFAILASQGGQAQPFRLLGPIVDEKLLMHECVDKLYRRGKAKARALLRCQRFFSRWDLMMLFKAHVRSQIEWCNGAVYHAAPSLLRRLDSIQESFLCHLGFSNRDAFLNFNMAPMQLRRDIGMLGVFWKIAHGVAHPDFSALFPRLSGACPKHNARSASRRHNFQFVDQCDGTQLAPFARSLFGLVKVWNLLPSEFVSSKTVKRFQSLLTGAARRACLDNSDGWERIFATDSTPYANLVRYCFLFV